MTQNKKPAGYFTKILVMDCETTGLAFNSTDPSYDEATGKVYQAVSWGLIVADAQTLKPIAKLYVEVKWDGESEWNSRAEEVHGLSKAKLEITGLSEEEAAEEIGNFIMDHFGTSVVHCAGHNVATFDIWFMRRFLNKFGIMFNTGNRFIDTSSIGFTCYEAFTSDQLFELMGVERGLHNALDDAAASLKSLRSTRTIYKSIIGE